MTKFDYQTGISKLPDFVKKSRLSSFIITNEYFLEAILYDGTAEVLKDNYSHFKSNQEKIEKLKPIFVNSIIGYFNHPPIVELIFADTDLPKKYKTELENLSEEIPLELRILKGINRYDHGYCESPTLHQANIKYDIAFSSVLFKKDDLIAISQELDEAVISNSSKELEVYQMICNIVCVKLVSDFSHPTTINNPSRHTGTSLPNHL